MAERDISKLKEKVRRLSDNPGVYLMKDRFGSILYVGKAKNLKRRVSTYFQPSRRLRIEQPKVAAMIELIHDFEILEVKSDSEALLLEGKLIKEWRPKYNTDFVDDKRFLLVKVDLGAELPKFRLVRVRTDESSSYFGPFAHSGLLRKTLHELRLKFGILLGDAHPSKLDDGRWALYDDARSEIYGHTNIVTAVEYAQRVENAMEFLRGKSLEWVEEMREAMQKAAANLDYEKAAQLRDTIKALEETTSKTRKFVKDPVTMRNQDKALLFLQSVLGMRSPIKSMECFDISHISGTFCVASMVRFLDGRPQKSQYRRFKIQSFVGNDDFRAMREVVGRRYKRLSEENKAFPDLIVIDGGAGQVSSALQAFLELELEPPMLIGLAKKNETIIFSDGRDPLNLPGNHIGRLLLQRIRDEAHRFANTYNADLRKQKLRDSVLEQFEGLGPVKRAALLDHFGNFERLKKATEEEILRVPGIGPKMAHNLMDWLESR